VRRQTSPDRLRQIIIGLIRHASHAGLMPRLSATTDTADTPAAGCCHI
jgi:hypothetical protein